MILPALLHTRSKLFGWREIAHNGVVASIVVVVSLAASSAALAQPPRKTAVDPNTLHGKVMVGYQGWFNCEGDGSELGWKHWGRGQRGPIGPKNVTIDLWPDLSELDDDERFATDFRFEDGTVAELFSSANRKTVIRHLEWMRDYDIDGLFVQRFANQLKSRKRLENVDRVLSHVRSGARKTDRVYAVMYDLSGIRAGQVARVGDDWKRLVRETALVEDPGYLHVQGKPLVAIWGVGFSDDRDYSLAECKALVDQLQTAGFAVMLGIPSYWRDGSRDAVDSPLLKDLVNQAEVVSPWTVGRYRTPQEASRHDKEIWSKDLVWCAERETQYLPVVFPGFSWHQLNDGPLDQIPRLEGEFFWSQVEAASSAGCDMIYVAMFDEVDEATAIFKCTNTPPRGDGFEFLTYEGLPSDHYLKLAGKAAALMRQKRASTLKE